MNKFLTKTVEKLCIFVVDTNFDSYADKDSKMG